MADRHPRFGASVFLLAAVLAALFAFAAANAGLSDPAPARWRSPRSPGAHPAPTAYIPPATLVVAPRPAVPAWRVAARVAGHPAVWLARRRGVTMLRLDQRFVQLHLHAGYIDGGRRGWPYGDHVTRQEASRLVAAINGGFKLTYKDVGFMSGGRVAVALKPGLASIVTYADGTSNIGSWGAGLPSSRQPVFSVLQNQRLLVDRAAVAASVSNCVLECWGGTLGLVTVAARSGLGITANGQLVWVAGEHLSPAGLAAALLAAGAVRAIELDINPWWVAGYLYAHRPAPAAVALVPGQRGIAGAFLRPYSRDFLAFLAN